jgi:REP element-mobilizing transposase RayT
LAGSFSSLHCHIVFATKNREPLLTPDVAPRIHEYLGGIVRDIGGVCKAIGGAQDHVHLLASMPRKMSVSDALCNIKSGSSKWINEYLGLPYRFAWQEGYGAFAISHPGIERVRNYILNQEEHHRAVSYQEEFVDFLRRNEVAYDERTIWM